VSLAFSCDGAPFSALKPTEQTSLREVALHVTLQTGALLLKPGIAPEHLWVIRSGHVQLDDGEHVHVLGPCETTPWLGLITQTNHNTATVLDKVCAWQIPKAILIALLGQNLRFCAQVFGQLAHHLNADNNTDHDREMTSLMLARVKDAYLQKPFFVDGALDLVSVCRLLAERKLTNALVRDLGTGQERIGMFTTTDLRDALLLGTPPHQLKVAEVARFDLVSLPAQAELFEALLIMLRHRIHRVLVRDENDHILGVLGQLDLMSFVSNHSHLITLQVERAHTVDELQTAALQVEHTVKLLQRGGMRIEIISRLVSELNGQIFARLWTLLAPPELIQNSCLMVMGSEGRGEQILKTDQDNALLLCQGFEHPALQEVTQQFSATLLRFGYPPCPGNIMVTNPLWCQDLGNFRQTVTRWIFGGETDGKMNLAIFMDARAVAGDAELLAQVRNHMIALASNELGFLSRMAAAIDQFQEPANNWWNLLPLRLNREPETFDLKKIGTFPIVHGVRALALQYRLEALSTVERLQALVNRQVLPAALGRDLEETLHLLMVLKLRNNLRQRALGQDIGNLVELSSLGALDRDQLKEALSIIRQFKQFLRVHYRLEA